MRTSDAVNRCAVSLQSVVMNFAECICECLVPMRNMAEIALNPLSIHRDAELESTGAMINDFGGVFGVS